MDKVSMSIREYRKEYGKAMLSKSFLTPYGDDSICINEKGYETMVKDNNNNNGKTTLSEIETNRGNKVYSVSCSIASNNPFLRPYVISGAKIMPAIVDVKVYNDKSTNLPCVTIVKFADGTMEKCSCSKTDSFSLETGISICVTKKLLSMQSLGNGHSIYNKIIDKGLKIYKRNRQAEVATAEKKIADKLAADRKEAKRRARKERKKKAEDERQIACYMEAMRRVKAEKSDKAKAEKKK